MDREFTGIRRKDLRESGLQEQEGGYEDAYAEDEIYGFKDSMQAKSGGPKIVMRNSAVKVQSGTSLYKKPGTTLLEKLAFNAVVYVLEVADNDWACVEYNGVKGYVNVKHLAMQTPMPGSLAKLHLIKPKETIEGIIKDTYKLKEGEDRRYYANVLLYINNPSNLGNRGIYVNDDIDLLKWLTIDYDRFGLTEGYLIWIPDKAYADSLMSKVNSGDYTKEWGKKIDSLTKDMRKTVDDLWPVGFGAFYGVSVGATFGIPLGADVQIETYFYRKDANTIGLKKYNKVAAGLDTGLSAGFYIGGKNTQGGSPVLGAHAGVNAEAKAMGLSYAEFEFPLNDSDAILSALLAISNQSEKLLAKCTIQFLDIIGDTQLSPMHYLKKSKVAVGAELSGNANVSAGVKKATSEGKSNDAYVEKGSFASERAADNYGSSVLGALNPLNKKQTIKDLIAAQLNVGADALVGANLKFGLEFENQLQSIDGKNSISSTEMTVFIEAGAKAGGNISIPFLINLGLSLDRSVGVKLVWTANMTKDKPNFVFQGVKLYTSSGEPDYYSGPASETEIMLGSSVGASIEKIKNLDANGFKSLIRQVKYKKRIEIANFLSNKLSTIIKRKKEEQQSSLKHSTQNDYFQISAYLDVEIDFSKMSDKVLDPLVLFINNNFKGDSLSRKFLNGFQAITSWIEGDHEKIKNFVVGKGFTDFSDILKTSFAKDMLPNAVLHVRIGAGIAGGFNAAAGAKVKLYGDVSGGVLVEFDVKQQLITLITNAGDFISNYAKGQLTSNQQGAMENYVLDMSNFNK